MIIFVSLMYLLIEKIEFIILQTNFIDKIAGLWNSQHSEQFHMQCRMSLSL